MRHKKILAAGALWGAIAWMFSYCIDRVAHNFNLNPSVTWVMRAWMLGALVTVSYVLFRVYRVQRDREAARYDELRRKIRALLAECLKARNSELIYELQGTIKKLDALLRSYAPKPLSVVTMRVKHERDDEMEQDGTR